MDNRYKLPTMITSYSGGQQSHPARPDMLPLLKKASNGRKLGKSYEYLVSATVKLLDVLVAEDLMHEL